MSTLKTHVSTHHYIRKDDVVPLSALKTQVSTHHCISKDDLVPLSALKTQVSTHHYISKDDLVPLSALKTQVSTHHYIRKDDLVPLSALKTQVSTHHYIRKDNFNYSVIVWTVWFLVCLLGCKHFFPRSGFLTWFCLTGFTELHQTWSCAWSSSLLSIEIDLKKMRNKKKSWTFKSDVMKKKEKMLERLLC